MEEAEKDLDLRCEFIAGETMYCCSFGMAEGGVDLICSKSRRVVFINKSDILR